MPKRTQVAVSHGSSEAAYLEQPTMPDCLQYLYSGCKERSLQGVTALRTCLVAGSWLHSSCLHQASATATVTGGSSRSD